jgi:hypothetical protein
MAKDQNPVEPGVSQVGGYYRAYDRSGTAHRLEALPEYNKQQEWKCAGRSSDGVGGRQGNYIRGLTQKTEDRTCQHQQDDGGDSQERSDDDAPLDCPGDRRRLSGPDCLCHYRVEDHQGAHREYGKGEEIQVAKCDGGQRLGRDVAYHDSIHDPHGHHSHLNDDHGNRQPKHGPKLGAPGKHPAGKRPWARHSAWKGEVRLLCAAGISQEPLGEFQTLG